MSTLTFEFLFLEHFLDLNVRRPYFVKSWDHVSSITLVLSSPWFPARTSCIFSHYRTHTHTHTHIHTQSYDIVGLMLMLRSCHKQCEDLTTQLKELGSIVKEHYFDHVSKILCERLDTVVNENTFAMRNARDDTNRCSDTSCTRDVTEIRTSHHIHVHHHER